MLVSSVYILFWLVFYGSAFLLPASFYNQISVEGNWAFILYFFILVPLISFFVPSFIKKIIGGKKRYLIHILFLIVSITLFMGLGIFRAISHSSFVGF